MAAAVRVVSYNVRYFGHGLRGLASTRRVAKSIASALVALEPRPAIVCLQEVETISLRSSALFSGRARGEMQLESFMGELERVAEAAGHPSTFDAIYFPAHVYGPARAPVYTTGLAVLVDRTQFTIDVSNRALPHSITHHHTRALKGAKQTRICAHLKLRDPAGRALHVFNTHLSLPSPFAKGFWTSKGRLGHGSNQLVEAETLSRFVHDQARGEAFIVCGDFNSAPHSPVYRALTQGAAFVGAQEMLGAVHPEDPRAFPTAGFMRLRMHLDHLFSSHHVEWLDLEGSRPFGDVESPFHALSDHIPLIGRFRL